jgi:hypothetical protein
LGAEMTTATPSPPTGINLKGPFAYVTFFVVGLVAVLIASEYFNPKLYYEIWSEGSSFIALVYGTVYVGPRMHTIWRDSWLMTSAAVLFTVIFVGSIVLMILFDCNLLKDGSFQNYIHAYISKFLFVTITTAFLGIDIKIHREDRKKYWQEYYYIFWVDLPTCCAAWMIFYLGWAHPASEFFVAGANAFQLVASNVLFSTLLIMFAMRGKDWTA